MVQFTLDWSLAAITGNANVTALRVGYRQKSVGGAYITTGLTGSVAYHWEVTLFATVDGVEINSAQAAPVGTGGVCVSANFTTDAPPEPTYIFVPLDTVCETGNKFYTVKTITGLSSPLNVSYDPINEL